jgi:hypothetical protein
MAPSTRLAVTLAVAGMVLSNVPGAAQEGSGLPPETLAQSTPVYAFQSHGSHPGLIFTRSGTAQETDPRVFVASRDAGWRLVQLGDELHNTVWVFAGRAMSGNNDVWGITEGGSGVLQIISSNNDGRSWKVHGSLQKIAKAAVLDQFSMSDDGRGTLILRLDADASPNAPRLGYYVYLTKNGGKAWSEAIYSQGKPTPPPSLLSPPDKTFDGQQATLDAAGWQRLLADLQPAG